MTDKEKRELKDGIISIFKRFNILDHTATIGGLMNDILGYINSLQEAKDVDLEKEIANQYESNYEEYLTYEEFADIAKHFFELGMQVSNKAQKGE